MSYYNYGSLVIQDLKTLETVTLSSTGITYKNLTTTIIPWSTIGTGGGGSVTDPLNVSSGNFSSIDSNISTLNIGAVKATTINVGNSNTTLNVKSGIFNASSFMLYSGNPGFSTCYLDNAPSNLSTQFVIGQNADQLYMGDNIKNKRIWIGRGSIFSNDITIGNSSSTVTVGGVLSAPSITSTGSVKVGNNFGGSTSRLYLSGDDIYHCIYSTGGGGDYTNFCEYGGWNFRSTYGPVFPGTIVASITKNGDLTATSANISSGTLNASYFTLSSKNFGLTNSCLLDTSVKDTLTTQLHLGLNNAEEIFIGNGTQNKKIDISTIPNTVNTITIGNASSTVTVGGKSTINTMLTVDGSAVNSGTSILIVKQNTGNYLTQTDGTRDPFAISSLNGGTGYLTMGMGVDTTYNAAYINCAMVNANRPLILAPRFGDVYIGPVPATFNKTDNRNAGSQLYINSSVKFQNNGSGISWYDQNAGVSLYSRIFDDGNLQFCTDDDMFFFTGSTATTKGTCSMALKTTFIGMGKPLYVNNKMYIGGTNVGTADSNSINNYGFAVLNIQTPSNDYRDGIAIRSTGSDNGAYILFHNSGGILCGIIQMTGGGNVTYLTSSDRRLKTNIRPMNSMLDKILSLNPTVYNWKSNNIECDGFIAQEVFEVFPQLRHKQANSDDNMDEPCDENGNPLYYGLDYGIFTPYIVKAMQEMKADYDKKIADLESRLLALESKQ